MSDKQPAYGIAGLKRQIVLQEQLIQRRHKRASHQLQTLRYHWRSRLVAPITVAAAFVGGLSVGFLGIGGTFGLARKMRLPSLARVVATPVLAGVMKDLLVNAISGYMDSRNRQKPPES